MMNDKSFFRNNAFLGTFDVNVEGGKKGPYFIKLPTQYIKGAKRAHIGDLMLEINPHGYEDWNDYEILVSIMNKKVLQKELREKKTPDERRQEIARLILKAQSIYDGETDGKIQISNDFLTSTGIGKKATVIGFGDKFTIIPYEKRAELEAEAEIEKNEEFDADTNFYQDLK